MNGMVSLVSVMEDGQAVDTAVVGREGTVGAFAGLGPWHAFTRATVQMQATIASDAFALAVPRAFSRPRVT